MNRLRVSIAMQPHGQIEANEYLHFWPAFHHYLGKQQYHLPSSSSHLVHMYMSQVRPCSLRLVNSSNKNFMPSPYEGDSCCIITSFWSCANALRGLALCHDVLEKLTLKKLFRKKPSKRKEEVRSSASPYLHWQDSAPANNLSK